MTMASSVFSHRVSGSVRAEEADTSIGLWAPDIEAAETGYTLLLPQFALLVANLETLKGF